MSEKVTVTSPFWKRYRENVVKEVIPYQWAVINDDQKIVVPKDPGGNDESDEVSNEWSHAVRNLRVAAGEEKAPFNGMVFQDSDVYKWLEEAAYALAYAPDKQLQDLCDQVVDLIARAQEPDGYLDTPFQIKSGSYEHRERFSQIQQSHEMYVMGHYIEAAVAYNEVTGNQQALDVAIKMADCLNTYFGPEEGKIHGADGHPEIELALSRLYDATHEERFLKLAKYFIDVRGADPEFYDKQNEAIGDGSTDIFPAMREWSHEYTLTARPIRQQQTAEGHAVRVVYLLTGIAHIARLTGDAELKETAERLWANIVRRRMYITGNIGSTHIGEAFTYDYDLPNDMAYAETCASVGLSFVARQMLEMDTKGEYADVLEKQIFNGAIAGISLDGRHFYYVNPQEAYPEASEKSPDHAHVLMHRAEWFECACCPANIARFIASIDRYLYTVHEETRQIVAHQFIANEAELLDGVKVKQESNFPWDGHVEISVEVPQGSEPVDLSVRIPSWSRSQYSLSVNGAEASDLPLVDGFVTVHAEVGQTVVALDFDMSVKFMRANTAIRHDAGKIAVTRGPVVYCLEEEDNPAPLWQYQLEPDAASEASAQYKADELEGVEVLTVPVVRRTSDAQDSPLYMPVDEEPPQEKTTATFIPYYAWANRSVGQMQVWLDSAR